MRALDMLPGAGSFIPPDSARHSINAGAENLVFKWVCHKEAWNDYGEILDRGMQPITGD